MAKDTVLKGEKKAPITLMLEPSMHDRLKRFSDETRISMSEVVRLSLAKTFQELEALGDLGQSLTWLLNKDLSPPAPSGTGRRRVKTR